MVKRVILHRFFKITLTLAIPIVAGFFAFGPFDALKTGNLNLSTQPENSGGDIIKPQENKPFLGFLTSAFGKLVSDNDTREQDADNNKVANIQNEDKISSQIPLGSALDSINPLGSLGDSLENDPSQNAASPATDTNSPTEEPAKSLYNYFVASSAIGFGGGDIQLSIALAANGENDNLNKIISGYEGHLDAFRQLEAPALAIAIHDQSLAILERYIAFLKNVRIGKDGDVQKTWNSPERDQIISESSKIIAEIKALEIQYNFNLPEDILPQ